MAQPLNSWSLSKFTGLCSLDPPTNNCRCFVKSFFQWLLQMHRRQIFQNSHLFLPSDHHLHLFHDSSVYRRRRFKTFSTCSTPLHQTISANTRKRCLYIPQNHQLQSSIRALIWTVLAGGAFIVCAPAWAKCLLNCRFLLKTQKA